MLVPTRSALRRTLLAAVTWLLVTPAMAVAQGNVPPAPTLNREQPVWIGYLLMFLMLMAVISVSLMPSKRGHQD